MKQKKFQKFKQDLKVQNNNFLRYSKNDKNHMKKY